MQAKAIGESRFTGFLTGMPPVAWILFVMVVIFSLTSRNYFALSNLSNIFLQSAPLMLVAFAQTLIVLTEGIDLSLGAQVSFVTVFWILLLQIGIPIYFAAILAVLASMSVGAVNGLIISKARIPAFIATLGTQYILYSISLLLTAGASISFASDDFQMVSETAFLAIPTPVWIVALMFGLTWIMLYKTRMGASIFAMGGNKEAVVLAGINTVKASIKIYAYAGFLTGIAGLIIASQLESGQPVVGSGWEFEAVAATVIGGTSFREGKGGISGTILGVLLVSTLKNGLNIARVPSLYQSAIIGLVILTAIVLDVLVRRRRKN
jgi:ribose transport system permease protein